MKNILAFFILLNLIPISMHSQADEKPRVDSPQPGEQVRGTIIISGNTDLAGFTSGRVYFGYTDSENWFPIARLDKPVRNGPIAQWDTTLIEDGTYQLKVAVNLRNGIIAEAIVNDIVVGNPTSQQAASQQSQGEQVIQTATPTIQSTPIIQTATSLPANPAGVDNAKLNRIMIASGAGTLGLFAVVIIIRALTSKRK